MAEHDANLRAYKRLIQHIERARDTAEAKCARLKDSGNPGAYADALTSYATADAFLQIHEAIVRKEGADFAALIQSENTDRDGTTAAEDPAREDDRTGNRTPD